MLIESIENEVDPMLDPLLEKQINVKGRSKTVKIGDQDLDYDDKFRLYMTSRMANPHFSPELSHFSPEPSHFSSEYSHFSSEPSHFSRKHFT